VMAEYTVAFYRDEQWSKRFDQAGINKPAGWVTSPHRSSRKAEILRTVDAINAHNPEYPAHVVEL
jgi:hypothetical protein